MSGRHLLIRAFIITLAFIATGVAFGCGAYGDVDHGDYGDCTRQARHVHNDHVFIADYHDHALCEWLKYE